jgi:radical SAM superfamily enzyme YgiQ (UPF0313 family)
VFSRTVNTVADRDLDSAGFCILTPFPGTLLYDRLERESRFLTRNWSLYTTEHVVFRPKRMTAETLKEGVTRISRSDFSPIKITKRWAKSASIGFYPLMGTSLWDFSMRRFYRKEL